MSAKFKNQDSYKKVLKQIKRRPELAPHFLLNARNLAGLLAGEQSFDRLAARGQARSSSAHDEQQRDSLMSPSLVDQIDFNQLGQSDVGI